MSEATVHLSKRLSWLLRHGAGESSLAMDEAGWAEITDVIELLAITRSQLDEAVRTNDKGRLVVAGSRVRACQGHSLIGMPVTLEGLEASWEPVVPSDSLWHGTRTDAMDGIAEHGILPGGRSHVHLAPHQDSTVGKRSSVDFLIEVSPPRLATLGILIYHAPNGVLLVRSVPVSAIVSLRPLTTHARAAGSGVRELRGLSPPP